jgi:hypothetical protein
MKVAEAGDEFEANTMGKWLDVLAAVSAFVAALFWFLSAAGKLPWDFSRDADPTYRAAKFSARMNAIGALASGISATLIGVRLSIFPS